MRPHPTYRFWRKVAVTKGGCWNWTGARTRQGYGELYLAGKTVGAHRFSYELHVGPIPERLQINHRCHNPRCVHPGHLYAGTTSQNGIDESRRKAGLKVIF